jgi:ferredoxin
MTFVVLDNCIKCKYTDCVDSCPVEAFHEGPNMLVINPDECIDCGVCVPECPIDAIKADEDLDANEEHFLELNVELSKQWPVITESKEPLDDADEWADIENKLKHLEK